jgi:hypothetical protein
MVRKLALVGCGCLVLGVWCVVATVWVGPPLVGRLLPDPALEAAKDPISIDGPCTRSDVASYLATSGPRLERLFAALDVVETSGDAAARLRAIDVAALRAAQEHLRRQPVEPCLVGLRDEEVALAETVIHEIETLQAKDSISSLDAGLAAFSLARGVRRSVVRLNDAEHRLRDWYGIPEELPAPTQPAQGPASLPRGAGEGGWGPRSKRARAWTVRPQR